MNSTAKGRNRGKESFLAKSKAGTGPFSSCSTIAGLWSVSRRVNQRGYSKEKWEAGGGNSFFTVDLQPAFQN